MPCRKKEAQYYLENFEKFSIKIPWDCFKYILINFLGFEMFKKSGSVRLFMKGEIKFTAHKPHGKGDDYISKYDRQRAICEIKKLDLL